MVVSKLPRTPRYATLAEVDAALRKKVRAAGSWTTTSGTPWSSSTSSTRRRARSNTSSTSGPTAPASCSSMTDRLRGVIVQHTYDLYCSPANSLEVRRALAAAYATAAPPIAEIIESRLDEEPPVIERVAYVSDADKHRLVASLGNEHRTSRSTRRARAVAWMSAARQDWSPSLSTGTRRTPSRHGPPGPSSPSTSSDAASPNRDRRSLARDTT